MNNKKLVKYSFVVGFLIILSGAVFVVSKRAANCPQKNDDTFITENGKPGAQFDCWSAWFQGCDYKGCYKEASKTCRQGYTVVGRDCHNFMVECK